MTKAELEKENSELKAQIATGQTDDMRVVISRAEKAETDRDAALEECNRLRGEIGKLQARIETAKAKADKEKADSETYRTR